MVEKKNIVEATVKNIRSKTRKQYTSEEKIRIGGRAAGGRKHCRTLPQRGDQSELLLQLVERIPGSGQTAPSRGYEKAGDWRPSQSAALRKLANAAKVFAINPHLLKLSLIQAFGESESNTPVINLTDDESIVTKGKR